MHISKIDEASILNNALIGIKFQIGLVEDQGDLGVTIHGRYQDDEVVERVKPLVIAVLNERKKKIEQDLMHLGVKFD